MVATKTLSFLLAMLMFVAVAQYDEQFALDLVPVCALAYGHKDHIMNDQCKDATRMTKKAGFTVIDALDNNDDRTPITLALLKRDSTKQIVIVFSGTKNEITLLQQALQIGPVDYKLHDIKGAKVSKFFYEHYRDEFMPYLNKKLKELCSELPGYDLYFTGHSLGGALATHAAADAYLSGISGKRKTFVYSFGAPRVGNVEFLAGWNSGVAGSYRIVHNEDIVPHLPPCIPKLFSSGCSDGGLLPFYPFHKFQEIFYKDFSSGTYKECDMTGEDQTCSNGNKRNLSVDQHNSYFNLPIANLCNTDDHLTSVQELLKN